MVISVVQLASLVPVLFSYKVMWGRHSTSCSQPNTPKWRLLTTWLCLIYYTIAIARIYRATSMVQKWLWVSVNIVTQVMNNVTWSICFEHRLISVSVSADQHASNDSNDNNSKKKIYLTWPYQKHKGKQQDAQSCNITQGSSAGNVAGLR